MQKKSERLIASFLALFFLSVLYCQRVQAQNVGTVRGTVTDPSAAVIPGATVVLTGNGVSRTAKSDGAGKFTLVIPPGNYNVRADSKGFVTYTQQSLNVAAGQPTALDIALQIASETQEVQVSDTAAGQVSVDPSENVGAIVIKNEELDQLPDDPDDLQSDLQALAGPAAGPNGAQFFVDGFSGGQLPPKSSIREIRINSNPFSSEFDRPGFGRIEILTKPGTDTYHGGASINYGDRILDTRNPFLETEPGYSTKMFSGNFGGPINKKTSFFLDFQRRQIDENNLIKAQWINPADPTFTEQPYISAYPTPNRFWMVNPRLDYAINPNNTLVIRYMHQDSSQVNGVGNLSLPTQLTTQEMKNNVVQITETMVIGTKAVDETRLQFRDSHVNQIGAGNPNIPGLDVSGAFSSGGSPFSSNYTQDPNLEVSNIVTITHGAHAIKVGGRYRHDQMSSYSTGNFNGSYTFSLNSSQAVPQCLVNAGYTNPASSNYRPSGPTSLDLYQETEELLQTMNMQQVAALGCGPTQYTQSGVPGGGLPPVFKVGQTDLGVFIQDDWRYKPNLTISTGLRYEGQNNLSDHVDFAPRVAVAWAPGAAKKGQTAKTVIRSGWGMFYDRYSDSNVLQTMRYNGVVQDNYQLTSALIPLTFYPLVPPSSSLAAGLQEQNIYRTDPKAQAPYMMQGAVSVERALPGRTSLSVNLINSRGVHTLRTRDINAPLEGTFGTALYPTGQIPFAGYGPIYNYETTGIFKQTQVMTNVNTRFNRRVSLQGYYALGFAHGNATSSMPMDQYNTALDYGRTAFDIRHRGFIGGSLTLPYGILASPFITMQSGSPFNITTGGQYNGDGIFNLRPALATSSSTKVKATPYGTFDLAPAAGATLIPINYGEGPAQFSANLRISRTWGWGEKRGANPNGLPDGMGGPGGPGGGMGGPGGGRGPGGPGGGGPGGGGRGGGGFGGGFGGGGRGGGGRGGAASGKKYSLTLSVNARNLINHVNLGQPNGSLTSPFFGQSTNIATGGGGGFGGGGSAAGVRRVELNLRLSF